MCLSQQKDAGNSTAVKKLKRFKQLAHMYLDVDGAVDFFRGLRKMLVPLCVFFFAHGNCVCGTGGCVCYRRNVVTSEGLVFLFLEQEEGEKASEQ